MTEPNFTKPTFPPWVRRIEAGPKLPGLSPHWYRRGPPTFAIDCTEQSQTSPCMACAKAPTDSAYCGRMMYYQQPITCPSRLAKMPVDQGLVGYEAQTSPGGLLCTRICPGKSRCNSMQRLRLDGTQRLWLARPGECGAERSPSGRACYRDECGCSEECGTASEAGFGSCGTRPQGSIMVRAVSIQVDDTSAQNANGLVVSRKRPNASNEGTACRLIEICSLSPVGDRR